MVFRQVKRFYRYLLGKAPELGQLDTRDVLLGKVVLDIHRKREGKRIVTLPIHQIHPIHPVDRETALADLDRRIRRLDAVRDEVLARGGLTLDDLARHLPSVSYIKVVREGPEAYIAFEGNGRLAALKKVFTVEEGIRVEVEEYVFRNPAKILRRMHRVRRRHGLIRSAPAP